MEKTIEIDGKQIRFKSTGATPIRYKAQFGKDYFTEIFKMSSLEKLVNLNSSDISSVDGLDFDVFYNIAWVMAKTADSDIPDPLSWLDTFDEFPMIEIIPQLMDLIMSTMKSKKK